MTVGFGQWISTKLLVFHNYSVSKYLHTQLLTNSPVISVRFNMNDEDCGVWSVCKY